MVRRDIRAVRHLNDRRRYVAGARQMIFPALLIAALLCASAWLTVTARKDTAGKTVAAVYLPFAVALSFIAAFAPLGKPRPLTPPQGEYSVLGGKVINDVAIYVLLDSGSTKPVYYELPYSKRTAEKIQEGLYGDKGEMEMRVIITEEGGVLVKHGDPVTGNETKTPERAVLEGGL